MTKRDNLRAALTNMIKVLSVISFIDDRRNFIELSLGEYAGIRNEYRTEVWAAIREYLFVKDLPVTTFKNRMSRAMANAFEATASMAWVDGGSEGDLEPEAQSWLSAKLDGELSFIQQLFQNLKMLKADPEFTSQDADNEAADRADGYAKTLDQVYNQIKIFAEPYRMLTMGGQDGAKTCSTCQRLKGQRHRASWWISRDYVPGPANSFECGGWQCNHFLFDDKGQIFTI